MSKKLFDFFLFSAGLLLLVTATAKFVSSTGKAPIIRTADPVFGLSFYHVFILVGLVEIIVGLVCFFGKRLELKAGLVAWLATSFFIYHIGLFYINYRKPCPCLGNLTEALHIPPQTADTAMKIILAYLFLGSYATLFWLWRQRKRAVSASLPAQ